MATQELETKIKALEDKVKTMENQVEILQTLLDVEKIKILQRSYGFYLEHWMVQEIVDCFSNSPDVAVDLYPLGIWKGKEGITKYFGLRLEYDPEFLHQIMQLSPIIHVEPGGKTARGRWYGYGPIADPHGKTAPEMLHSGTYEMEYVKEDGVWKFKVLAWRVNYINTPGKGLIEFDRAAVFGKGVRFEEAGPDVVIQGRNTSYPSGYIYPFHYKHPVTGKKTGEDKINSQLGFNID